MDLGDKTELCWLSAVLADVGDSAPDCDFLIVGAMARDVLLHYGHGVPITRATTDIDLGVAVGSWDEFSKLREACLESDHFTSGKPGSHRLIHRSGVPIDLIPFGGVEREDGTIEWPEDNAVMGVLGYREARATAMQVLLPDKMPVATVCLPMLAILKLMAWSERHTYTPRKDASDLFLARTPGLRLRSRRGLAGRIRCPSMCYEPQRAATTCTRCGRKRTFDRSGRERKFASRWRRWR